MNIQITRTLIVALIATLPLSAQAHRSWLLPSTTILSGDDAWITVDAAVSNDLFYFEHHPMVLEGIGQAPERASRAPSGENTPPPRPRAANRLQITAPDGSSVAAQNGHVGKYRSVFDVQLEQKGTYKLAVAGAPRYFARYQLNGEDQRWMGALEDVSEAIPADAEQLQVNQMESRMEVFVTSGNPTDSVFTPTGQGLELQPVTHPNDLFAGEASEFVFLLDGQPAAGVEVTVIPGGVRHRDQLNDIRQTTDADGKVSITWPGSGFWWLEARVSQTEGLSAPLTQRRASYTTTLEVLAP
uniref:Nickel uptake substrate-specific transmembrane region n=1 Tax=uncultured bacterium IN-10 TaxID=1805588 RepID=A0A142BW86_9BACT|nr:nickel uptake substrate-specific transmembrane region [uncultured bacterium IN-10]